MHSVALAKSMRACVAGLALFALCPLARAWDLTQLLHELAQQGGARARFVEKKYLSLLDTPLSSSGELAYVAPDRIEKDTLLPARERLALEGNTLTVERGNQKLSWRLDARPEALAFVESIRGTLSGDRGALERHFALNFSGTEQNWSLVLVPSEKPVADLVRRIIISGAHSQIRSVEYTLSDGDRSVMTIEPVMPP